MAELDGKTALVTGASSGIGRAVAVGLARRGASLVLLARGQDRARTTVDSIKAETPAAQVEIILADLSSQSSIRTAVSQFSAKHDRLDIFVGAAGVFHKSRTETGDGIESTFAVNYLSNFLLANLLQGALKEAAPSRVIFIASRYGGAKLDFDDLMLKHRKFTIMNSVAPSKLAEVLLAQELAERWAGSGVVVNAVHPGLVAHTHLLDEVGGFWRWMTNAFGGSPERGADTVLWLATSPEAAAISGKLLAKRKPMPTPGQGSDPAARTRLWVESTRLAPVGKDPPPN